MSNQQVRGTIIDGATEEQSLDKKGYISVLKDSNKFNLENFSINYITLFSIVIIALIMYVLSFVFSCFDCSPFRSFVLFIYVYFVSLYILILYIKKNCNSKLSVLKELYISLKCTIVFSFNYILFDIILSRFSIIGTIKTIGPFKILLPTLMGIIPLYFYLIRARQLAYKGDCLGENIYKNSF